MSRYRITFDTILRLTAEVGAADGKQAPLHRLLRTRRHPAEPQ